MPRLPILTRTLLYERLPRGAGIRLCDFNLVTTTLGGMLEPRVMNRSSGATANEDVVDSAFTDMQPVDEGTRGQLGLNAYQWPVNYNPAVSVD